MVKITILVASLSALATTSPVWERLQSRQSCKGQSCIVADISRSTGQAPIDPLGPQRPKDSTLSGIRCAIQQIQTLNRECRIPPGSRVQTDGVALPVAPGCEDTGSPQASTSSGGFDTSASAGLGSLGGDQGGLGGLGGSLGGLTSGFGSLFGGLFAKREEVDKRQLFGGCTPYRLIFAKGTTEPGELGITVGPSLSLGLVGSGFTVTGVNYPADLAGINCIGLPGGIIATRMLEEAAAQCPQQKIVMSGYSQGAMVVREAVAFARPNARRQVVGVVTFGDPFNGAPIADFDYNKIKIYCTGTDGVCKGELSITLGHLSYVGIYTTDALAWIKRAVR